MTNYIRLLIFITIVWMFISCKLESSEHSNEEKIFITLLPDLVKEVYRDPEVYLNPPISNGTGHNQNDSAKTGVSSGNLMGLKTNQKTNQIEVSISATIKPVNNDDTASVNALIKSNHLEINLSQKQTAYKLDLSTVTDKCHHFKVINESSLEENQIQHDGQKVYHVGVAFSRIQFDENRETGILTGTYLCQPRCGIGYVIIIHKTPKGWKIKEVFPTWVS